MHVLLWWKINFFREGGGINPIIQQEYLVVKYTESSCVDRKLLLSILNELFYLQLLKTLFGTNLASQYEGVLSGPSRSQGRALRLGSSSLRPGLYHYCFMAPYTHFTQALADASLRNMVQAEQEQDSSGWAVARPRCSTGADAMCLNR